MKKWFMLTTVSIFLVSGCSPKEDVQPKNYQEDITAVSTYAGIKVNGFKDDINDKAQFYSPTGITNADKAIYVADTNNHAIRKVENNQTTTITGSYEELDKFGKPIGGYKDGALADALFNKPTDIAVGDSGTLYVTDSDNGAIRKITTDGQVETLVKNLNYPSHITVGENNTLYVTEKLAHRIIQIDEKGKVKVIAGGNYKVEAEWLMGAYQDGVGEEAQFNEPTGIVWSPDGFLYVSDTGNQRIRKVELDGTVTTVAGGGEEFLEDSNYIVGDYKDGAAEDARFNFPQGLALFKDQSLVITDTLNHRIRILSKDGQVTTLSGTGTHGKVDGSVKDATFDGPSDVTVNNDGILVADQYSNSVRLLSLKDKE